jgi:hypothetical protein
MSDLPTPVSREKGWFQRNRWALLSLVGLIPLAILASSFRMLVIYLPWQYNVAHRSTTGSVHLLQTYVGNERDIHIDVTATLVGAEHSGQYGKISAVPGATVWKLTFDMAADPDVVLNACQVWLVDAQGREYSTTGGKAAEYYFDMETQPPCVPSNAKGPSYSYFSNEITPSENPRPPSWRFDAYLGLPADVKPTQVRIAWSAPDYIEFDLP